MNFCHRYHILTEADAGRKPFLITSAAVVERKLIRVPEVTGGSDVTAFFHATLKLDAASVRVGRRRRIGRRHALRWLSRLHPGAHGI